jgi:HAD superfamily hydrolase (TIGR01509 family)
VIRATLFDVGGVLVHLDWRAALARWDERCRLGAGGVLNALFHGIDDGVLIGKRPADEHWAEACARLGFTVAERNELMGDLERAERFNHELAAFIAALRPQYRTGIVSNGWTDARTLNRRRDWDAPVDEVVISAEVGVAKPSRRIFEIALERIGVDAREAAYVDDQPDMVEAALRIGLHAIRYKNNDQVIRDLNALLQRP